MGCNPIVISLVEGLLTYSNIKTPTISLKNPIGYFPLLGQSWVFQFSVILSNICFSLPVIMSRGSPSSFFKKNHWYCKNGYQLYCIPDNEGSLLSGCEIFSWLETWLVITITRREQTAREMKNQRNILGSWSRDIM